MYIKFICISLLLLVVFQGVNTKKTKKKRVNEDIESTPQPNVVTYSTFGFKDVGPYDGFVPNSPDYDSYLTSNKQNAATRLYAPAFPSAVDSTGLGNYYDPQSEETSLRISSDGYEGNAKLYEPASINFITSSNYNTNGDQSRNSVTKEMYDLNSYTTSYPIYGTKLSSKHKNRNYNNINHTDYNIFDSVSSVIKNGNTAATFNVSNNYPYQLFGTETEDEKLIKIPSSLDSTSLKFPKVVDFTSVKNYYPTSVESNKFTESMLNPYILDIYNKGASDTKLITYDDKFIVKDEIRHNNKEISDVDSSRNEAIFHNTPHSYNNFKKYKFKDNHKSKVKSKQQNSNELYKPGNIPNAYEYSNNYSDISFKYESGLPKRPFNSSIDDIVPAGSSIDFVDYQLPEKQYPGYKTTINKFPTDYSHIFAISNKDKYKSEINLNTYKSPYTTVPTTSSYWGNIVKDIEFSSYKTHPKKESFNDDSTDDIVHIPKRQINIDYEKFLDKKPNDWEFSSPYKSYKHVYDKELYDWTKDFNNKYKSEEDLLGLRNHDTSHPSYAPFKPSYNNFDEDIDYKNLAAKWKQNFLKANFRDSVHEYESLASKPKPVHVPLPKPYPIEVPHPVVIPVPQPYPVKVPIPKPVAVPIIREITVPVEKPVPYPVIKKVPYPIEKFVPVPVVKQVPVPVVKPYPVHVPQIRPVFHHTKAHDDRDLDTYENDYFPRPDTKWASSTRTKNTRIRPRPPSRRPSRTAYQEHTRRRVPSRRPSNYQDQRQRRPYRPDHTDSTEFRSPYNYRDDFDEYDADSDFERYCKRTGKC